MLAIMMVGERSVECGDGGQAGQGHKKEAREKLGTRTGGGKASGPTPTTWWNPGNTRGRVGLCFSPGR